jgi:tetratricopeptide (TPR) repeat protein
MSQEEKGPATIIAEFERRSVVQEPTFWMLFDYASALRRVGRRVDAHRVYDSIDRSTVPKGKEWLLYLNHARLYSDEGRFSEAEKFFRSAVSKNPGSTVPWIYLAGSLAEQEKFEDAIAVLLSAVELDGDRDEVYLNLAYSLRTLGRLDQARDCLQRALAITPDYPEAHEELADINAALGAAKAR